MSIEEVYINGGINKKTIKNIYGSNSKQIIIQAANTNYDDLIGIIKELHEENLSANLILSYNEKVSVELTMEETMVVLTSLAVKRAAITGAEYSRIGINIEKKIMQTLCMLFNVPKSVYAINLTSDKKQKTPRQIDFFLNPNQEELINCEVKLMGFGNPESADAVFARNTKVFVADSIADSTKGTLKNDILWTNLRSPENKNYKSFTKDEGYMRFHRTLEALKIPYTMPISSELDYNLENIFKEL